jgi:hypothetical protein
MVVCGWTLSGDSVGESGPQRIVYAYASESFVSLRLGLFGLDLTILSLLACHRF